ncbi:hypothetical protein IFR04_012233 [Cadophora malorum]|uniref:Uncharacterized protein n=1 Tax=Cadophora malorum TaxID=108018 RepID=A0A8H7W489_9HELO|nr:hypothetical protein IFR04_012233 [Cadophora malorum]
MREGLRLAEGDLSQVEEEDEEEIDENNARRSVLGRMRDAPRPGRTIGQLLSRSTTEHPQTFSMNGSVVGRGSLEFLKYRGRDEQRPDGVEAGPGAVCTGRSGYRRRWKFCKASK